MTLVRAAVAILSIALGACTYGGPAPSTDPAAGSPASASPPVVSQATAAADPSSVARGAVLFERYECARCHARQGMPLASSSSSCTGCHRAIHDGTFVREDVRPYLATPSLDALDGWVERAWIARFLLRPHDLRPRLDETMPALPLTDAEARDLAAFLAPSAIDDVLAIDVAATYGAVTREADDVTTAPIDVLAIDGAAIARGRAHAERLGCPSCHAFGALWPAPAQGPRAAPDLAFARERLVPSALVRFLLDPSARSPGTVMPRVVTDVATARELAAFLLRAPLPELLNTAPATAPSFERLPLLDRPVMFDEVEARVLRRSCWHCHSDASLTYGDGGPGNTGGLGFAPREIDLSSYTHLMAGALDREGQRGSLFREVEGAPLLLRALLARHDEERGVIDPEVRGMPLGLPPLDAEQIQLVESWIAQGRPR